MQLECPAVCTICWNYPDKELEKCIISTVRYNVSNCNTHFKSHKPEEIPYLLTDVSTITSTSNTKSTGKKLQNKLTNYTSDNATPITAKVATGFMYKFFNEANIAIMQATNPNLKKFVDYLLDNASNLRTKRSELYFSRLKYKKEEASCFSYFLMSLRHIVCYCRNFYKQHLAINTPFLYVSHDGWDSTNYDVLGVSIHILIPVYWKMINLAVGLKRVTSKKSANILNATLAILNRYVNRYVTK
jgi:hypothetical protein